MDEETKRREEIEARLEEERTKAGARAHVAGRADAGAVEDGAGAYC